MPSYSKMNLNISQLSDSHALGGLGAVDGNIKTFSSFSRKKEMIVKKTFTGAK